MDRVLIRHSFTFLIIKLVIDAFLFIILIGIVTAIVHIIQYLRESMTLGAKSIILETGFLTSDSTEIPYNKINSISVKKGLIGNILGYGDIVIYTGNDVTGIVFKGVDNPNGIKSKINEYLHL